jgi:hypothetical protein
MPETITPPVDDVAARNDLSSRFPSLTDPANASLLGNAGVIPRRKPEPQAEAVPEVEEIDPDDDSAVLDAETDPDTETDTEPLLAADGPAVTRPTVTGPIALPGGVELSPEEILAAIEFQKNWRSFGDEMAKEGVSSHDQLQATLAERERQRIEAAEQAEARELYNRENANFLAKKAAIDEKFEAGVLTVKEHAEELETQRLLAQMKVDRHNDEILRKRQQAQWEETQTVLAQNAVQGAMRTYFGGQRAPQIESFLAQYEAKDIPTVAAGIAQDIARLVDTRVTAAQSKKKEQQSRVSPETNRGERGGQTKNMGGGSGIPRSWAEADALEARGSRDPL